MSELTAAHSTIEKEREVTNCPDGVDLQWWVGQLIARLNSVASENEALKFSKPSLSVMMTALDAFYADDEVPERAMMAAYEILRESVQTPTTDRILRVAEARGVEKLTDRLQQFLDDGDFVGDEIPVIAGAIYCGKELSEQLREGKAE
ncbi:hypothetical protein ACT8MX_003314 [Escherichia albertii]